VKLRGATGALAWRTHLAGPGDFGGSVNAVAVDTAGVVVAAGRQTAAGTGAGVYGSDFTVAWFVPDSGVELGRYVVDRNGILAADAVAATDDGSVLVAGEAGRLTVLELASPGANRPDGSVSSEPASSSALSALVSIAP